MRSCEMCSTPLPRLTSASQLGQSTTTKSAPATRPGSPYVAAVGEDNEDDADPARNMMKLSFRKGGDKAFYAVLKRSLMGKAWEVLIFRPLLKIVLLIIIPGQSYRERTFESLWNRCHT